MYDIIIPISRVIDVMSPAVAHHHMQVAYLSYRIAQVLEIPAAKKYELVCAAALHDIGAFSLKERMDMLDFEDSCSSRHAFAGSFLLKDFQPFSSIAEIIKYHHTPWENGKGAVVNTNHVPIESHILHIADRTAVSISKKESILKQIPKICDAVRQARKKVFVPGHVDALLSLEKKDYIWLEAVGNDIEPILRKNVFHHIIELGIDELLSLSEIFCSLIDFKSPFTATHSSGVAAVAVNLSKIIGFSENECKLAQIAANLHDLGKIAIPSEILEKKGKLTEDEWFIMRSHVYYTHRILDQITILDVINQWSALHQERLNGTGYPFGYKSEELPLGSKIMAVADVFTALTEDRPYRKGLDKDQTVDILQSMAEKNELGKDLVEKTIRHYDYLDKIRRTAQDAAYRKYEMFQEFLTYPG